MKKEYLKPEILVDEFISEIYMQSSSPGDEIIKPGDPNTGWNSNNRRSGWGDLWGNEE